MAANWHELKISQAQLDEVLNFDLISTWAIGMGRVFFLQWKQGRKSLLITEGCSLFLIYLLFCPITLICFRNSDWLNNNSIGLILVLIITGIISLSIIILLNYYLWQKAKQLKVFAVLLDKVEQYNNLVGNLNLIGELNAVALKSSQVFQEITEFKNALNLTRNSLIKSIELEKIINRDRNLVNNYYQLLTNLESGLVNLDSLGQTDTNNYHQLFAEAVEIGLSVHRELRKNNTLN